MKLLGSIFIIFLCITSASFADIDLWMTRTDINSTTADINLYARSTSGDLTQIDIAQWAIAYTLSQNTPSTTLQADFAGDWGPSITIQTQTIGSYDRLISWIGAGSNKTITSGGGGTLLATVRFTRVSTWGDVHIVSIAESGGYGTAIWNNNVLQTLNLGSDISLPVQMSNITANVQDRVGITISWSTESEVNSTGFNVLRSMAEKGEYKQLNTAIIPSHGNSSEAHEYEYTDRDVQAEQQYWYKIQEISMDGASEFFGPIMAFGVDAVPTEFALSKNYPNPFNPETVFQYQLPEEADVTISVYSLLGRKVLDLVSETKEAGYFETYWNGANSFGQRVASGIYILHMQAGDFQAVQKMSIIR